MNLKNRKRLRRILRENSCLTEFKRELKSNGENFKTIRSFSGAFIWGHTKKGNKFWGDLSEKIQRELCWSI